MKFADAGIVRPPPGNGEPLRVFYMINHGHAVAARLVRSLLEIPGIRLTVAFGKDETLGRELAVVAKSAGREIELHGWTPLVPELLAGRRVLAVHSATGVKRDAITGSLLTAGARAVQWLTISATRSFAEQLDLSALHDKPDICLLGAGVGKAALFPQLEPLGIPCIDAGFAFEVWADSEQQWHRSYMVPAACHRTVPSGGSVVDDVR